METIEKLEKRENELLDMLGRLQIGTEDYNKCADLLEKIVKLKDLELKTEHSRLDNNVRNDIDQQKIEVELKRIDVEIKKIRSNVGIELFGLLKLGLFGYITYHGEQVSYGIKEFKNLLSNLALSRKK